MKSTFVIITTLTVAILIGCDNGSSPVQNDRTPPAADRTGPTAGNNGVIAIDSLTTNTIQMSWTAASDDRTAVSNLAYAVYYSSADNIQTLADAEVNGTLALNWAAATTSATIQSLAPDTEYYINTFVRDASGNVSHYTTESCTLYPLIEISWYKLQSPSTISAELHTATTVYGRYYSAGFTDTATPAPSMLVRLGWFGSGQTRDDASYVDAVFNTCVGNNHEYQASTAFEAIGTYTYFFSFSGDRGVTWVESEDIGTATIH